MPTFTMLSPSKKKKKIQKKSEIFKKRNFLGQALELPHPGNQVSIYHVWIFSYLNIMNGH